MITDIEESIIVIGAPKIIVSEYLLKSSLSTKERFVI